MIDYDTVAIHWMFQVEDSYQFDRDDFESPDQMTLALLRANLAGEKKEPSLCRQI